MPPPCFVLYVDDHEDSAIMFKALLSQWEYEVMTAGSAATALELAGKHTFDLYVLDRRLPDASGMDLCRQLHERTPNIPVVLYSGDSYQVMRAQALAAGADAYVTKPNIEELIETVQRLLAERECAAA